ncbi:MAG: Rieske 2Fe-2S domain-containing protein [Candidatus Rokubacteria bacterium]|nr:Rieske 2Fe-2S domain-containing protein [Candidatus Rokubacteria bacterium]
MTATGEWRILAADLPPGTTAKFRITVDGRVVDGFIVGHDGGHHAYVNRCPHVGTSLDLWPNDFLDEDGRTLVCSTHGARFEPDTGHYIAGPCAGDALQSLPVRREGDELVVAATDGHPEGRT